MVLARLSHRAAYAALIGLWSGVAGIVPFSQIAVLRVLQRGLVYLDIPISAVGLVLPWDLRGVWLFFFPPHSCRGIAPDAMTLLANQVIIAIPTYLAIFALIELAVRLVKRRLRSAL